MATPSSVLPWRIPGTGEPGGLPSMGSHRVGHDRSDLAAATSWLHNLAKDCMIRSIMFRGFKRQGLLVPKEGKGSKRLDSGAGTSPDGFPGQLCSRVGTVSRKRSGLGSGSSWVGTGAQARESRDLGRAEHLGGGAPGRLRLASAQVRPMQG